MAWHQGRFVKSITLPDNNLGGNPPLRLFVLQSLQTLILSRHNIGPRENMDSARSYGLEQSSLITYYDEQKNGRKASLADGCISKQQQRENNSKSKKWADLSCMETLLERY
jgi:hypothetical protein